VDEDGDTVPAKRRPAPDPDDYSAVHRPDADRTVARVALATGSMEIAVYPTRQILEIPGLTTELGDEPALTDRIPLHLFRVGCAEADETVTKRRPVADVLV
jgi:hypothetical protein